MRANPFIVILGLVAFALPITGISVIGVSDLAAAVLVTIGGTAAVALLAIAAIRHVPKELPASDPVYEEQKRRDRDPNA